MSFQAFGLRPVDDIAAITGTAAPQLRCIAADDQIAYAAGDLMLDVPNEFDQSGIQVATAPWARADGRPAPAGPPFVLIAPPPGLLAAPSFATPVSAVPASKARDYYVWAMPALKRVFEVAGDTTVPSRPSETTLADGGYVALPLQAQAIASGQCFGELAPGSPANGSSSLAVSGASFTTRRTGRSQVRVLGFAPGNPAEVLEAGALFRVQLLETVSQMSPMLLQASPTPTPPPTPAAITVALLTLSTPNATLDVGELATASLPPGITGNFVFTRDGSPIAGATASGNTATYAGTTADADRRINVIASALVFSAGLTPAVDPAAILSFYGIAAAGSTLTAALIAGTTGTVSIARSDGTVAATLSSATSASYVLSSGDLAKLPFTATASNVVMTAAFPTTSGSVDPSPFLALQAYMYGSTVAAGDVFSARLADSVTGHIEFTSNGAQVTSNPTPQLNSWSYEAQAADAGHAMGVVISDLSFSTGGIFGRPVMQSATSAPLLYSLDITVDVPNRIRIGVPSLNNLDTTSVPPTSAFTVSGTLATAKTVTAVAFDNSDPETKYVDMTLSSDCVPGDAPTLAYSGTAIRYPGGAPMAAFTEPVFSAIPPPATLMYAPADKTSQVTSPSAGVFHFLSSDIWVSDALLDPSHTTGQLVYRSALD